MSAAITRQTLTWDKDGIVGYADEQAPLCTVDEYFGEPNQSSVRHESDLCQYKPQCDVIVNATAYAPSGQPASRFSVGLKIVDTKGRLVLEKNLTVTGPRAWEKNKERWTLSESVPITNLPLRYEYAYGGECRIATDDPAATRVPSAFCLTPAQRAQHPDQAHPPLAHTVYEPNPIGLGYSEPWYLYALESKRLAAPQIESADDPVREFGKHYAPQGFGVVSKANPTRLKLAGTLDDAFIKSERPLPEDFDFAVWNAAPLDQQLDELRGDETLVLTNLCSANARGVKRNAQGDTQLRLTLPADVCFCFVRLESGEMFIHPMKLDTLLIEPETCALTLVWRTLLADVPDVPIRMLEARMHSRTDHTKLEAEIERIGKSLETPATEVRYVE